MKRYRVTIARTLRMHAYVDAYDESQARTLALDQYHDDDTYSTDIQGEEVIEVDENDEVIETS